MKGKLRCTEQLPWVCYVTKGIPHLISFHSHKYFQSTSFLFLQIKKQSIGELNRCQGHKERVSRFYPTCITLNLRAICNNLSRCFHLLFSSTLPNYYFLNSHFKTIINPAFLKMTKAKLGDYLITKHYQLVLQAGGSYHVLPLHPTINP